MRAVTTDVGVDIVSFGGTKNGLLGGEAVVVLKPALADGFAYLRKQTLQLASKMRFLAAQFDALLTDELWRRCASHANAMAARLADALAAIPEVSTTRPVADERRVRPGRARGAARRSRSSSRSTYGTRRRGEVRWMCSWDTTADDVDEFVVALRDAVSVRV